MFQRFARFMMGRYGSDKFNFVILITAIVISIFAQLIGFYFVVLISYALMGYAIFRSFSRNIDARRKELYAFNNFFTPVEAWFKLKYTIFKNRKVYKYFKCPNCSQQLRAPKGRGKIEVRCQKCGKEFKKKV